jgi:hypothetical protein
METYLSLALLLTTFLPDTKRGLQFALLSILFISSVLNPPSL